MWLNHSHRQYQKNLYLTTCKGNKYCAQTTSSQPPLCGETQQLHEQWHSSNPNCSIYSFPRKINAHLSFIGNISNKICVYILKECPRNQQTKLTSLNSLTKISNMKIRNNIYNDTTFNPQIQICQNNIQQLNFLLCRRWLPFSNFHLE